jgi:hypothetical protein
MIASKGMSPLRLRPSFASLALNLGNENGKRS